MNGQRLIGRVRLYTTGRLYSDPFSIKNMHMIRETSDHFDKPKFISFDGFGTLYTPKVAVVEQYYETAQARGIDVSLQQVTANFPEVFKQLQSQYPNYGKHSENITTSDDWWRELIVRVLEIDRNSARSAQVCEDLLTKFHGDAYMVYPDVVSTLAQLKDSGIKLVVSSNSDPRVAAILKNLDLAQYFDAVYTSYELGFSKPHKGFFDRVLANMNYSPHPSVLQNVWHVGDSHSKDFLGAIKAGWNGILLDRQKAVGNISAPENDACFQQPTTRPSEIVKLANNRIIVSDLSQLASLFN